MNIRKLEVDDAACAHALVLVFKQAAVSLGYSRDLLADPANLLLVAESDGETIGFVWAHWLSRLGRERKQLFVYEIEVAEPHRRQGVGSELMRAVLTEASSRESDAFVLTNRANTAAVAFYEHLRGRVKEGDDLLFVFPYDGTTQR